jgi:hypothetical protein
MNALDALRERYALPDSVNRLAFSVDTFDENGFTIRSRRQSRQAPYVSKREVSEVDRRLLVEYRRALLESTGSATGSACDTFDAMFTCNEHWENIVARLKKN